MLLYAVKEKKICLYINLGIRAVIIYFYCVQKKLLRLIYN